MDFASILSKEIAKAKPAAVQAGAAEPKSIKRAELEKQREAAYLAEQEALQAARAEAQRRKRKLEEEEAERKLAREEKRARLAAQLKQRRAEEEARREQERRKRLGLPELLPPSTSASAEVSASASSSTSGGGSSGGSDMDNAALDARFRQLGEPIRLFGETEKQRLRRWQRLTAKTPDGAKAGARTTSLELVPEEDMKVAGTVPQDEAGRRYLYRQLATYFTVVLREWEAALSGRPLAVRESFQGRAATNAFVQSRDNMKPLFAKFEKGDLDILDAVVEIVKATQERRYVDANDAYLRLSIGKA
jgi:pre-mRNA-splicing factor 18